MEETIHGDNQASSSPTKPTPGVERTVDILMEGAKPAESAPAPELSEAAMNLAAELQAAKPKIKGL